MANTKQVGHINLARLEGVGIMNIKGKETTKKCVVIPVEDNDIFVKVEEKTAANGQRYTSRLYNLGVEIYERQEPGQFGETHYIKHAISGEGIARHDDEWRSFHNGLYIGGLKTVDIPSSNQASTIAAPTAEGEFENGLPF